MRSAARPSFFPIRPYNGDDMRFVELGVPWWTRRGIHWHVWHKGDDIAFMMLVVRCTLRGIHWCPRHKADDTGFMTLVVRWGELRRIHLCPRHSGCKQVRRPQRDN